RTRSASSNTVRAGSEASDRDLPMPTDCEPWPGNSSASVTLPAQQDAAPHEACAESREQDEVAGLQAALADALVERDRDRGGGGVPEPVHVLVDLLRIDLETLADGVDDPKIRLV